MAATAQEKAKEKYGEFLAYPVQKYSTRSNRSHALQISLWS